jgi:hypothetical protein
MFTKRDVPSSVCNLYQDDNLIEVFSLLIHDCSQKLRTEDGKLIKHTSQI